MNALHIPLEERLIGRFLRQQADTNGNRPFLTIAGRTMTFREIDQKCRAAARGLERRGIVEGDRVMIMTLNRMEFVVTWFASTLLGAAAVPINPNLKGILLELVLRDSRPDAIVIHSDLVTVLGSVDPELVPARVLVVEGDGTVLKAAGFNVEPFDSLYLYDGPDPEIPGDFRRLQMISYTSGTTGASKGVMISNAMGFCAPLNYIKAMGMTREDSIYAPLPLFHSQAMRHGIMPSLVMGTHMTIDEHFSASRFWERAAECRATLGMIVTALTPLLMAQAPKASDRFHGLRAVFNCKYNPDFEARFGVRTVAAFAMTETSQLLHTPYPDRRPGSVGRINADWEVRLVDADDRPVPRGEPGEMICRPKLPYLMMSGYLNKPDVTLEAFRNLWFHTGDILREDEDGYFYFLDRKKDRIRRRGENVSSVEVEIVVSAHPAVAECAAIPYPADDGEDLIRAVLLLKPKAQLAPAELYGWLRDKLPKFMLPRYIEIAEDIPRNGTGKIEKYKLIEQGLTEDVWDSERHAKTDGQRR